MSGKKNFLPEKINSSKENKTTKAAIASAAFVVLKAKYKYLILLQGS